MRQPTSKIEKIILGISITFGVSVLALTSCLYSASRDDQEEQTTSVDRYSKICIAGAYERTDGKMVVDMFAPTIGVETIEDVSKETYEHITKELGAC